MNEGVAGSAAAVAARERPEEACLSVEKRQQRILRAPTPQHAITLEPT